MKKFLYILIGLFLASAGVVYAAPGVNIFRNIHPETDSTYFNGTTTKAWLGVVTDELCLNGTCRTSWPTGGGGGAGGGWSTSTPNIISTNWASDTNALVGINTTTPWGVLTVKGISGTTTPTFVVASSSDAMLLRVASNGSTTISSLGTGPVYSSTGSLYINGTTGTGATVQQTSPTLVTPILGVASGTALTLSNNLYVDGSVRVTGQTTLSTASSTSITNSGILYQGGNIQMTQTPTSTITTTGTALVLQQTGDTFGTTRLTLVNRNGQNGAMFEQAATGAAKGVIDFMFKPSYDETTSIRNIRVENRTTDDIIQAPEFQFGNFQGAVDPTFIIADTVTYVRRGFLSVGSTTPTAYLVVQGASGTTTPTMIIASSTGVSMFKVASNGSTTVANLATANCDVLADGTGGLYCGTNGGGGISGGTPGKVAYFTSATAVAGAALFDNGTVSGVNATSSTVNFNIQGTGANTAFRVASSTGVALLSLGPTTDLRFYDTDASNFIGLQASSTVAQNIIYTFPAGDPPSGGILLSSATSSGVSQLNWVQPTLITFTALSNEPPSSNFATFDTRNSHPVLDFDASTEEYAVFSDVLPRQYSGGGLSVLIHYAMTTANDTASSTVWNGAFERLGTSQDMDADSFAATSTITSTNVATSGQLTTAQLDFTNAQIDGLLAGEGFRFKLTRQAAAAGDTATGDAEVRFVEIKEKP